MPIVKNTSQFEFSRIADILRQGVYRGYVVLEFENISGEAREKCREYIEQMRPIFA